MPDIAAMAPQVPVADGVIPDFEEPVLEKLPFTVLSQKVELEIDFLSRSIKGTVILEIQPSTKNLTSIKINTRQCTIPTDKVTVDKRPCSVEWEDCYKRIGVPDWTDWSASHWACQKEKIESLAMDTHEPELTIHLPHGYVREANAEQLGDLSNRADIGPALAATSEITNSEFHPIHVLIPFSAANFRDGLHFVGLEDNDLQYPHMYTQQSSTDTGISRCIFPCFDRPDVKPQWTISIKCGRTLGQALTRPAIQATANAGSKNRENGISIAHRSPEKSEVMDDFYLEPEAKLLEMTVVCSGDNISDVIDPTDTTNKIVTFEVAGNMVFAGHIAFAVGPFEYVNLSAHRPNEEELKLGQTSVKVNGYCLPGRSAEVNNAAQPLAQAIDHFCLNFGAYPFKEYTICFVGDQIQDTVDSASLTLCSDRLLHPEEIIDELLPVARKLVHALARQYFGVSIVPDRRRDTWLVVGIARYLTDVYLRDALFGVNEFEFDMKKRADRVRELDVNRPSLSMLGKILFMGAFELEFMELKAPLVLHMLDRRIAKDPNHSVTGLTRLISQHLSAVNTGGRGSTMASDGFQARCHDKCKNLKIQEFFNEWVFHAGYPKLLITERYDKKNMKIKMSIKQIQGDSGADSPNKLKKSEFAREFKEDKNWVMASGFPLKGFTGSFSIRVYEADGTRYDHPFAITSKDASMEFPFNIKYKRARKEKAKREREAAAKGDSNPDVANDVVLYCLGDVLQSREDIQEWQLEKWDAETEKQQEADYFEFISFDADHEWRLCSIDHQMEPHMWAAQLQQDRDVAAQVTALEALAKIPPCPVISSILVRTVMDTRYFHGVRTTAAEALAKHANKANNWIGCKHLQKAFQVLFCEADTAHTPRPNNFEDWQVYMVQKTLAKSIAKVRDAEGNCPLDCRKFILDQLRLNDNSDNVFSDAFYIANLLEALANSMIPEDQDHGVMNLGVEMDASEDLRAFQNDALEEIERYQKIDKTMGSWKNIYTTACLKAKLRLMQAGVIARNAREFLAYLKDGTYDLVQIEAMSAAVDLGILSKSDDFIRFFMDVLTTSTSTFLRYQFFEILWRGLASVAFGEHSKKEPQSAEGFVIANQDDQESARAKHINRTENMTWAVTYLKSDLKDNEAMKTALWDAVKSPHITLGEQMNLLEYCSILYDPLTSLNVTLKMPRYLQANHVGKGRLVFTATGGFRTSPRVPEPEPEPANLPTLPAAPAPRKIKLTSNYGSMSAPAKPSIPKPAASAKPYSISIPKRAESVSSNSTTTSYSQTTLGSKSQGKSQIVTLKLSTNVLRRFPSGPKNKKRKATDDMPSPATIAPPLRKQSIVLKHNNPSSSVYGSPRHDNVSSPKTTFNPFRKPLPDSAGKERKPLPDGRKPLPTGPPSSWPSNKKRKVKEGEDEEEEEEKPSPKVRRTIKLNLSKGKLEGFPKP